MISTTFATKTYKNFINNEWVDASSGNTIESNNPADKEPVGYVQSSTEEDLNKAVAAAHKAKGIGAGSGNLHVDKSFLKRPIYWKKI